MPKSAEREPQITAPMLLRLGEAAATAGVSRDTIRDLLDNGTLGFVRVGSARRVPADELKSWVQRNLTKAQAP